MRKLALRSSIAWLMLCLTNLLSNNAYGQCSGNAVISGTDTSCVGTTITFTNSSATGHKVFVWFWGDGGSDTTVLNQNMQHTYVASGSYTIRLVWSDSNCTDTASHPIYINALPAVNAGNDTTACSSDTAFALNGTPVGGIWSGSGVTSGYFDPTAVTAGAYTLTYTYTDTITGCINTDTRTVTVNTTPTAGFTISSDTVCSGTAINFTNSSTGATSYLWNFGNGTSTATNPTRTFNYTGSGFNVIPVTLYAYNGNCTDSIIDTVVITAGPNPVLEDYDFGFFTRCSYSTSQTDYKLTVQNTSTTTSTDSFYIINWGDGSGADTFSSSLDTVSHTYSTAGAFTLTFTAVSKGGCSASITQTVYNGSNPAFGFSSPGNTAGCAPLTITFPIDTSVTKNNTPNTIYTYTFNDGSPPVSYSHPPPSSITHTFTTHSCGLTDNSFTLSGSASNPCGITNATVSSIRVSDRPEADFDAQDTACLYEDVPLNNNSDEGRNVVWNPSLNAYICDTVVRYTWTITPTSGWSFVSGNASSANPIVQFTDTGIYHITLSLVNRGLSPPCGPDSFSRDLLVIAPPQAAFTKSSPTLDSCLDKTYDFTNNSTGSYLEFEWFVAPAAGNNFIAPTNSSSTNPSILFTDTGEYVVALVASNYCGTDTARDTIIIKDRPRVDLPGYQEYCGPTEIDFSPLDGNHEPVYDSMRGTIHTYNWWVSGPSGYNFEVPTTSGSEYPTIQFTDTGLYTVHVTATNECGTSDTATQQIRIYELPGVNAGNDTLICYGETLTIGGSPTASGGRAPYTYAWTPAAGLSSTSVANPTVNITATTTYYLTVTDSLGCTSEDSITITVNPQLFANAGSDIEICFGDTTPIGALNVASGGTAGYTYSWTPATGLSSASVANPLAYPSNTTTYTVVVTDNNNCSMTDSMTVIVNPELIIDAGNDTAICEGQSVTLGGTPTISGGTGPYTYSWSPATDLNNASAANPVASPLSSQTYVLTVTDNKNCSINDTVSITVHPLPAPSAGNDTAICKGDSIVIGMTAIGGHSYSWSPTTGLSDATIANPIAKPNITTTYILTETIIATGCVNTDSIRVVVNDFTTATLSGTDSICLGQSKNLTVSFTGTAPWEFTYSDGTNDSTISGINSSPFTLTVTPDTTTTYTLVSVNDSICNGTTSGSAAVKVFELPTATVGGDTTICIGNSVNVSFVLTGAAPWEISYSDGVGIVTKSGIMSSPYIITAAPTNNAIYSLISVKDKNCTGSTSGTKTITVKQLPTTSNAGNDQELCNQTIATLAGNNPSVGMGTWTFVSGPGGSSFADSSVYNTQVNGLTTGTYVFRWTIRNSPCDSTTDTVVVINYTPSVGGTLQTHDTVCAAANGGTLTLSGENGDIVRWEFSTDGGTNWSLISNTTNSHTYTNLTTTTRFRAVVQNGICPEANSNVVTITVDPVSVGGTVGPADTVCSGSNGGLLTLSGHVGNVLKWQLSTNNGSSWTDLPLTNPFISYSNLTESTLFRAIVKSGLCEQDTSEIIRIQVDSTTLGGTLAGSTVVCARDNSGLLTLSGHRGTIQDWIYSTNNGASWTSLGHTASTYTFNNLNTTTIYKAIVKSGPCPSDSSTTATVTVNPLPTPDAGIDTAICFTDSIQIGTPAKAGISYSWSPSAGLSSITDAMPFAKPSTTTTYIVTETIDSTGCKDTSSMTIIVHPLPTVNIAGNQEICKNDTATLTFTFTGTAPWEVTYLEGGTPKTVSGITAPTLFVKVAPAATTVYKLVSVSDNNCADGASDSVTIIVNPLPIADAGNDTFICYSDSITIGGSPSASAGTGIYSYGWSPATGLSSTTVANPEASPLTTTTYTLIVFDAKGCSDTDMVTVTVNPELIADAGSNKFICYGDTSTTIGGSPSASGGDNTFSYLWTPAAGLSSDTDPNPIASPTTTTVYTLTVTDGKGCTAVSTVQVTVNPELFAHAGADTLICYGDQITIGDASSATGGAAPYSYAWSPATGLDDITKANPLANPLSTTTYILTVTDNSNCSVTDTITITVNPEIIADAGNSRRICYGDSTAIGGTPSASGGDNTYTYAWSPATGLSSTSIANPIAKPLSTTTYLLTVTDSKGCVDTSSVTITVNPELFAHAGTDELICYGDQTTLGAGSAATGGTAPYTYLWSPSTGLDDVTKANPIANPLSTTTYVLTVTDVYNCEMTDTVTITVNPQLFANAGSDKEICNGDSTNLGETQTTSGGTSPYTYSWLPITGLNDATAANPIAFPSSNTTYIVTVTDAEGCSMTDTVDVIVHPLPTASFGPVSGICFGSSATVTINLTGTAPWTVNYTENSTPKSFTTGSTSYSFNVNPNITTVFKLVSVEDTFCYNVADDSVIVDVNPPLSAHAGTDTFICYGDTAQLGATSVAVGGTAPYTYSWTPATGLSSTTAANPSAAPTTTTTYIVTVTDDRLCEATDTITVTVNPELIVSAGAAKFICYGDTATIGGAPTASGGSGIYTYAWSPSTGLSDTTAANPSAYPLTTTTYTLIVTDDKGCQMSSAVTVTVNPELTADAGIDKFICYEDTTTIGATTVATGGTGPYAYAWSPSTGLEATNIANPKAYPLTTTTYTVTITDAMNCIDTSMVTVTVNPMLNIDAGAAREICFGQSTVIGGSPTISGGTSGYTYLWTPSTGLNDNTLANPTASSQNTTLYTVTVTDAEGCQISDTVRVIVNPLPIINAGVTDTFCNTSTTATLTGYSPSGGTWKGLGVTSAGVFTPITAGKGTHTLTYVYTDSKGCTDSAFKTVVVIDPPVVNAGTDDSICVDLGTYTLTGFSPSGGTWSGTGVSSSGVFNTNTSDTGTFILTYTYGSGTCEIKDTKTVRVNPLPVVNAGVDVNVCVSEPTLTLTGFTPTGGTWSGTAITNPSGIFAPKQAGVGDYNLVYTYVHPVTNCVNRDTITVHVRPLPVADFTFDTLSCTNVGTQFTNTSTGSATYMWDFGDGGTSTDQNPSHVYTATGTYTIQLISFTSFGCSDTVSYQIRVTEIPFPSFIMAPDTGCGPLTVNFTNTSSGEIYDYFWDFGNGTTSTDPNPTSAHYVPSPIQDSFYCVRLTVSNLCGSSTFTDTVRVTPLPVADFVLNKYVGCSPLSITFNNKSTGKPQKFYWDFGNGNTSGFKQPSQPQVYTNFDTSDKVYTIRLIVENNCGTDTISKQIIVKPRKVFSVFNVDTTVGCAPLTIQFTDESVAATVMSWDFGDGNVSNIKNPTHTYTQPGKYIARQFVSDNCSADTTEIEIIVHANPVAQWTADKYTVCTNSPVEFTNLSTGISAHIWDFGDGDSSNLSTPTHTYSQPGKYAVTLWVQTQPFFCTDTRTDTIEVLPLPDATYNAPVRQGCQPFNLHIIKAEQTNEFYTWDFGDGNTATGGTQNHTYTDTGTYTVTLRSESFDGCKDSASFNVRVHPIPIIGFELSQEAGCDGPVTVNFNNTTTGALAYLWDFGNGQTSTNSNPSTVYQSIGSYTITLVASNQYQCFDTIQKTFTVYPTPEADFSAAPTSGCEPLTVFFSNNSAFGTDFAWDFGDGTVSNEVNPIHTYETHGSYKVKLVATEGVICKDSIEKDIIIVHPVPRAGFTFNVRMEPYFDRTVDFVNVTEFGGNCYWDFGDSSFSTECNPTHRYNSLGIYTIRLIAENEFGCIDTFTQVLDLNFEKGLYIPNALTPMVGPPEVRVFKPSGKGIKEYHLWIYTAWGELLWESTALTEDGQPAEGWDGYYKDELLPQDVYVWKAEATFGDGSVWEGKDYGTARKKTGTVHLVR